MKIKLFILFLLSSILQACELEKTIDVEIPGQEPQLVAEAYLTRNEKLQVLLLETDTYFDTLRIPIINDARVILLKPDGFSDTLTPRITPDLKNRKVSNYITEFPIDSAEGNYRLRIEHNGRILEGVARFLPPPLVDTIEIQYNPEADSAVRFLFWIKDFPGQANYYRIMMNEDSLSGPSVLEFPFADNNLDGSLFPIGTTYRFEKDKKYHLRIFHIDQQYYAYLRALSAADRANGNPFAQPSSIRSPMAGNGYGIFSSLNYIQKVLNP